MENLQLLAARHAQAAAQGGPDFYGEDHILRDLRQHLVDEKSPPALIEWMLDVLKLPNFALKPEPLTDIQSAALAAPPLDQTAAAENEEELDDFSGDGLPSPTGNEELVLSKEVVDTAVAEQAVEPVPSGYVISLTKRGKCRRLHFTKDCWMVPDHQYKQFEVWAEVLPSEADISCVCSHCMTLGRQAAEVAQALEAEPSSSSSGEEGPAPKRSRAGASSDEDCASAAS